MQLRRKLSVRLDFVSNMAHANTAWYPFIGEVQVQDRISMSLSDTSLSSLQAFLVSAHWMVRRWSVNELGLIARRDLS